MINLSIDMHQCRICLQEDNIDNLIYPCKCNGYSKYIHRECLNKWRNMYPDKNDKCDICNYFFMKKGIQLERNRFFKSINNHFLTIILLLIFVLSLYTCFIYAIDVDKKLAYLTNLYGNNLQILRIYFIINYSVWILIMKFFIISELKRMNFKMLKRYILYPCNKIYIFIYSGIILHYTIGWNYTNIISDVIYGLFIEFSIIYRHTYIINCINEEMDEIDNYK
jgi:hypothetical protein